MMHSLRKTLIAKFDVALAPNSVSGSLIAWRYNTAEGMQEDYKSGEPHAIMLSHMQKRLKTLRIGQLDLLTLIFN